jgi:hypothetical protein
MKVVLLVLRDEEGEISFLVHPEWRRIVGNRDVEYFESLFQDFLIRAKVQPELLFKHLCGLCVGPLVTKEVGQSFVDDPLLGELTSGLIKL